MRETWVQSLGWEDPLQKVISTDSSILAWRIPRTVQSKGLCCCSVAWSCLTLCHSWSAVHQSSLSFTISQSFLKLMFIESVTPSNRLTSVIPFSSHLQSLPASGLFSHESALRIRWPKYWGFSFTISPSNEYSRLISSRIDWFDLLIVQETLKSLLQHHSSKTSILWCSAFLCSNSHIHTWLLEKP